MQAGRRVGLVQIYTGEGKGKTTAALGLALRAAGHGLRTFVGQFLKGRPTGELKAAKLLAPYLTIEQFGEAHFVFAKNDARQAALARRGLQRVRQVLAGGEYDIVILEEINVALDLELIPLKDVIALLEGRPPEVELVLPWLSWITVGLAGAAAGFGAAAGEGAAAGAGAAADAGACGWAGARGWAGA